MPLRGVKKAAKVSPNKRVFDTRFIWAIKVDPKDTQREPGGGQVAAKRGARGDQGNEKMPKAEKEVHKEPKLSRARQKKSWELTPVR